MNKRFNDLIKIDWKTQDEVVSELREELSELEKLRKRKCKN